MEQKSTARKAVVVGAGPVGCLCAISLAKQGWRVEIYEGRPDMRLPSSKAAAQQRSINLAMSSRGIAALQAVDSKASQRFLRSVIPMRGRMIHGLRGELQSQPYDRNGQCINSIDRALLNEDLLEEALSVPNIQVFFEHKVTSIDFDARIMSVRNDAGPEQQIKFDFCVGADGSHSIVRRQLMRVVRMDYQQTYIPHEYLELRMPAGPVNETDGQGSFLIDPNHLHIWPRHSFMLIALPNKDRTFTCTLFAPTSEFDQLDTEEKTLKWFGTHFPDALPLIGEDNLLRDFKNNPRSSLITVKAQPYHYKDRAIILGDAAHAMVPFYGQGLNCGLEDVRVLDLLLRNHNVDPSIPLSTDGEDERLARVLRVYSESRHEDLLTISDLAMDNYTEMRHSVTTPGYIFRKALDNILYALTAHQLAPEPTTSDDPFPTRAPSGWLPLYTMVTFRPDISYALVKRKAQRQNTILSCASWISAAATVGALGMVFVKVWQRIRQD
ncbi:FAD/NAD-P-binding domain-containing protein [Irpex rosettiformis]|uniref:FAD/NAD-P-binding domain-containing protein n=1 Tax=Irpex rosettiformis TaxID=378272 RepID=A0ACB8UJY0_9APHY|nr:FAD/NAD-P-binding domain-containing protein [Irpex rosettiformis]